MGENNDKEIMYCVLLVVCTCMMMGIDSFRLAISINKHPMYSNGLKIMQMHTEQILSSMAVHSSEILSIWKVKFP